MPRWVPALLLFCFASSYAQQQKPPDLQKNRKPAVTSDKEEVPPEEDTSLAKEDVSFNPLQAVKEIDAGNYYFKKGSYLAAEGRFKRATVYNEGNAEAWLKLGETREKLKDRKAARDAYAKYLEVASDAKNASEIRKKLEKLK
jgi:predicted Zn-dependent protease